LELPLDDIDEADEVTLNKSAGTRLADATTRTRRGLSWRRSKRTNG
jgi:hypothetical protein